MTKYEDLMNDYDWTIQDSIRELEYNINVFYVPIFVDIARRKKEKALNLTLAEASEEI